MITMRTDIQPAVEADSNTVAQNGRPAAACDMVRPGANHWHGCDERPRTALEEPSPGEIRQLLAGDWRGTGALRLDSTLTHEEVGGIPFLADARSVLDYVKHQGRLRVTRDGSLTRSVIAALLPRLRIAGARPAIVGLNARPALTESDVRWLPALRQALTLGELLVRREGALWLTNRGSHLLAADHAGELYRLLFRKLFRQVDLRALTRDDRHARLQATIAYSFFKLRTGAQQWASLEALAETAWLASAKDLPNEWEAANIDVRHYAFQHRVLDPLVVVGLLEERRAAMRDAAIEMVEFRCTPLYDRFMRFELSAPH